MYEASRTVRDEEIVRTAWRHAEVGGNDLLVLKEDSELLQLFINRMKSGTFNVIVFMTTTVEQMDGFAPKRNLLRLLGGENTLGENACDVFEFVAVGNYPNFSRLARPLCSIGASIVLPVDFAAKLLLALFQHSQIVRSQLKAKVNADQFCSVSRKGACKEITISPNQSSEFGFPNLVSIHTVKYTRCEGAFQEGNSKDVENDWVRDPSYAALQLYAGPRDDTNVLVTGYLGDYLGIKFFSTTNARVFVTSGLSSLNVYATLLIGEGAYGVSELDAQQAQIIFKERGSGGATGDQMNQLWSLAWKATNATVIVNQNRMVRIEHSCTAA